MSDFLHPSRRQFAVSAAAAAMAAVLPVTATGEPSGGRLPLESPNSDTAWWVEPSGEPTKTIFQDRWHAARKRARHLPRGERALFLSLLDSVESAWPHVRTLQHLHDQFRPGASGAFATILDFIDYPTCNLFRDVALRVAAFVPVPGGGMLCNPDFNSVDGDADQFGSFVAVLGSASYDPALPAPAALLVRRSTSPLLTWYDRLMPTLQRAADVVQGP